MFGTVFKLSPPSGGTGPWAEHILHTFTFGGGDGIAPYASLIFDSTGTTLYGTTAAGGNVCNCGTVFSLTRPSKQGGPWVENILYNFLGGLDGLDGASPHASLIFDAAGSLYGTTITGGLHHAPLLADVAQYSSWTHHRRKAAPGPRAFCMVSKEAATALLPMPR